MTLTAYYVQSNSSMHRNECIALCKNIKSAERPILHQISSLMYPKIQQRQVMFFIQVVGGHPGGFFDSNSLEKVQR